MSVSTSPYLHAGMPTNPDVPTGLSNSHGILTGVFTCHVVCSVLNGPDISAHFTIIFITKLLVLTPLPIRQPSLDRDLGWCVAV